MNAAPSSPPQNAARPEEQGRADVYGLLAALLLGVDPRLVARLRDCGACLSDDGSFAQAWTRLVSAAAAHTDAQIDVEYHALFRAAGAPRLNPYGSFYLAGAPMEKPLAAVRRHLRRLGLRRAPGATELEDHLGGLCEGMHLLIVQQRGISEQHAFFARHLQPWYARCCEDLRAASPSGFYGAVGRFAHVFLDLESAAFELAAGVAPPIIGA
jgi:TorA maturation chaperone TorD